MLAWKQTIKAEQWLVVFAEKLLHRSYPWFVGVVMPDWFFTEEGGRRKTKRRRNKKKGRGRQGSVLAGEANIGLDDAFIDMMFMTKSSVIDTGYRKTRACYW